MKKKFNEEFTQVYENPSLLTKFDLEDKAHIELDPVTGDAILQAKKVREKMKDDFKEQDKLVDEFIKESELEENPKLPEIEDKKPLKDMKLVEKLTSEDVESLKEELNPNMIHDFIDEFVPMEELGKMAYEWLTSSELVDMLSDNGYSDPADLDESYKVKLTEAQLPDMIAAFTDKIEELESVNESLTEDVPLEDLYAKYDEVMDKLMGESLTESKKNLTEDYSNFIGRPLKDFLKTLPSTEKVNIDYATPSLSGSSGIMGLVNQVNWEVADRLIKDIQLGDEKYYKFKILTEDVEDDEFEATWEEKFGNSYEGDQVVDTEDFNHFLDEVVNLTW